MRYNPKKSYMAKSSSHPSKGFTIASEILWQYSTNSHPRYILIFTFNVSCPQEFNCGINEPGMGVLS